MLFCQISLLLTGPVTRGKVIINDDTVINIESSQLLSYWDYGTTKSLTKSQCISIAQLLGKLGYALEPDMRFSSDKLEPNGYVVLSRLQDDRLHTAGKDYIAATTLLQLASAVSAADGDVSQEEEQYLEKHLENVLELSELEKNRLRLYMKWLLISEPKISGMKKKLESMASDSKKSLAQFLLTVAFVDGIIDPGEIKILKKIYGFLELDKESIYSDLHKLQAGSAIEPVTIKTTPESSKEYLIPKEHSNHGQNREEVIVLDPEQIRRIRVNTQEVQKKLIDVFNLEKDEDVSTKSNQNQIIDKEDTILGLDRLHSKLVKELLIVNSISRSDFEDLCDKYSLMPDGTIETINNKSFELYDEPLIEEDDEIELNKELCAELSI